MKKLARTTENRVRVLRCAEKLGIGFFDYDSALWLFAPSGKVFSFGATQSHLNFYEYGTKRGKLLREALSKAHPHSQPELSSERNRWITKNNACFRICELL